MKLRLLSTARLSFPLAAAIAALFGSQSAHAATYYWDDDGVTLGFGTAGASSGTWAAPTAGPTAGWSLSATGAAAWASYNTTTADTLNFGTATDGLGAGAINVSGTVASGSMAFGAASGAITLSGGTISLPGSGTVSITVNNATDTISSNLGGGIAGQALSKLGTGTLVLSGANTFGNFVNITAGVLNVGAAQVGGVGPLGAGGSTTLIFNGGTLQYSAVNQFDYSGRLTSAGNNGQVKVDLDGQTVAWASALGNTTTSSLTLSSSVAGGTLTWSAGNSYSGGATVNSGATLKAGISSALVGSGLAQTITNGPTGTGLVTVNGTLDVSTSALGVGGLSGAGTVGSSSTGTAGSLTIVAPAGTKTFSGAIVDIVGSGNKTVALTKSGVGTQILTGTNTYSGATTVTGGILQIGDGTTAGTMAGSGSALTMGGGTLKVAGPALDGSSQTVASLSLTAATTSTITLAPGTSGDTTLTITGSTVTTGAGAAVNFNLSAGTTNASTSTVGNTIVAWSPSLTGGIIGSGYSVTDTGGTGFATTSGGNVVRLTDSGTAGLPTSGGGATGSYFVSSLYTPLTTTTPGSLVEALSGAVAASNVTVDTTGLASGANLALGTNLLTLGGLAVNGANPYEISGSGGLKAASGGGTLFLNNGSTGTVTISAPIVNNATSALTINGTGTTILSGTNTYTGATILNGGTVRFSGTMAASPVTLNNAAVAQLGTATGLTSGNSVTFGLGATGSLQLLGNSVTIGALNSNATLLGTPVITNNNGGSAVVNATLTIDSASTSSFGGVIQDGTGGGSLRLTKSGTGVLLLNSTTSNYSGGTVITAGRLNAASDAALGNSTGSITLNGGTLGANNTTGTTRTGGINLISARDIIVGASGGSMFVSKNNWITTTGALSGSGALTLTDPGGSGGTPIFTFSSSANTYTGSMTLPANDVRVSSLGDAAGKNIVFTGALSSFSLNDTGATAGLTFNNRAIELSNTSATVSNLNTTYAFTIGSNLVATGAAAKVLTLSAAAGPTNIFGGNIVNATDAGSGTIAVTKSGAGTWVLGGANTYTGKTTVSAGLLSINSIQDAGSSTDNALGKPAAGANSIIDLATTGTLQYTGTGHSSNRVINLTAAAGGTFTLDGSGASGTFALTGGVTSAGTSSTSTLVFTGTGLGSESGVIANGTSTNVAAVTKSGTGTWTLSNANTYTGATAVQGGTLVAGANAPSASSGAFGNASSEVSLGVAGGNSDAGILTGGDSDIGRIIRIPTNNTTDAGTRVLTLGGNTATNSVFSGNVFLGTTNQAGRGVTLTAAAGGQVTFSGVIQNPTGMDATTYTVTKAGLGTVVLSNTNTYTGATNVTAGKLFINGNQTSASGAVSVSGGATLGGTGTIGGNTAIADTGKLEFNLSTVPGSHSKLNIATGKTLSFGANCALTITSSVGATTGLYTLVTALGGITGKSPAFTVTLPAGWTADEPAIVGNDLQLNITSTGGGGGYAAWSGGAGFGADANNDGVSNGMAWVLGAADTSANAIGLLPTLDNTSDPVYFIFTYRRSDAAYPDANTAIKVEYGSDLSTWTPAVAGPDIIITETNDAYPPVAGFGVDKVEVKIKRTLAVGSKLFARLNVVETP